MSIQVSASGPLDGDVLSQKICDFLGVFNSIPQFIASDDWEIEIAEGEDPSEDWLVECFPSDGLDSIEVSRVVAAVERFVAESGGRNISTQYDV
ncbi:hypothetical protein [Kitasatospora sp. A2-31]|uniref:hypothetical protein n=1 Tax=Kitasatospora sp. A2-31 TaxID=2916414 RepID=UPI001EEB971E|nr:hypothetical protein [Kitasatospora sp. A2-31]MCG6495786.1 hypothetical protein [Kitasatospora sp. A2-31]